MSGVPAGLIADDVFTATREDYLAAVRRRCGEIPKIFGVRGIPGFRSKLWMVDRATGDFAALYEWDSADQARTYAEGLAKVLRPISRPGSVTYELVPDTTVAEYLAAAQTGRNGRGEPRAAA